MKNILLAATLALASLTTVSAATDAASLPMLSLSLETAAAVPDSLPMAGGEKLLLPMPLHLTARDFVTKVYGVLSPTLTSDETGKEATRRLAMTPSADNLGLWLEKQDGYSVNYYGMQPDVTAMALFSEDAVSDFGFFFLFPYSAGERKEAVERQVAFCGSLLQELQDIGAVMGNNLTTDAIFEAGGDYEGNFVLVRLIEEDAAGNQIDSPQQVLAEADSPSEGRFVLFLNVTPDASRDQDLSLLK